jgi:hypothetical protein
LHDEASAGWAWRNAAFAEADPSQGSMHRGAPLITNVGALCSPREARIRVHVRDDVTSLQLRIYHGEREHLVDVPLHAAAGTILRGEHDVCWQDFGVKTGDTLWLRAEAHLGDAASATLPQAEQDRISLQRPSSWSIEA